MTTYNIGPGETYTTFTLLIATETLDDDDIVDGGGNTFREVWGPDGAGTSGHPIILRNATINGSDLLTSFSDAGSNRWYATLSGVTAADMVWDGGIFLADKKTQLVDLVNAGDWWHDTGNNRLYIFKTSQPTSVEASQRNGILAWQNYINIQNIIIEKVQNTGIDIFGATSINVSDCTIRNTSYHGIQYNASTGTVDGCTISNPGLRMGDGACVEIIAGSTVTVQNSTLFCDATYSGGNQDGIMIEKSGGAACTVTIDRNQIYGMDNSGVSVYDNGGGTITVRYNKIYDNTYHGIQLNNTGDMSNFSAYYNVIYGNGPTQTGRGLSVAANSDGGTIYNNVFYDNNSGVTLEDDCSLTNFKNNICYDNRGYGIYGEVGASITNFDYNCFNANDSADYDGFVEATNDVTDNPLFVSATNFRLQSGSPCRNAGVDLGLTQDFKGTKVPCGSNPDMGAFEFVGYPDNIVYNFAAA